MSMIPVLRAPTPDDPRSVIPAQVSATQPIPAPTAVPTPTPTPGSPLSQNQQNARAYMDALLASWGLSSLSGWAYEQLIAGNSPIVITQLLYERPEFKQRYPAYAARRAAGLTPMSVQEMLTYENNAKQLFRASGLPLGFYDSSEALQDMMTKNVSLTELSSRIQLATEDYFNSDPVERAEFQRLYNLTPGQHLAYIMDSNVALPLIERQFLSASLAAEAVTTTYGSLSREEAEGLAGHGVTTDEAARGFSTLATERGLFTSLPGEVADNITRAEQIAAAFYQDATAAQRIKRRQESRVAEYEEGGGFAATAQGVIGLGSNRT